MILPYFQINATSDERTNSLIIRAPENIHIQIQKVLEVIDNPKNTKNSISIKINNILATDLSLIIQNLINHKYNTNPGICIGDNKTNKLILIEEPKRLQEITKIINDLDTQPKYFSKVFIAKLKNAKADNLSNIVNSIR